MVPCERKTPDVFLITILPFSEKIEVFFVLVILFSVSGKTIKQPLFVPQDVLKYFRHASSYYRKQNDSKKEIRMFDYNKDKTNNFRLEN